MGADRLFFSRIRRRNWTGVGSRPRRRLSLGREFVARAVADAPADAADRGHPDVAAAAKTFAESPRSAARKVASAGRSLKGARGTMFHLGQKVMSAVSDRQWIRDGIEAFFADRPMPSCRGGGGSTRLRA